LRAVFFGFGFGFAVGLADAVADGDALTVALAVVFVEALGIGDLVAATALDAEIVKRVARIRINFFIAAPT
jgi:hypothetical protein